MANTLVSNRGNMDKVRYMYVGQGIQVLQRFM